MGACIAFIYWLRLASRFLLRHIISILDAKRVAHVREGGDDRSVSFLSRFSKCQALVIYVLHNIVICLHIYRHYVHRERLLPRYGSIINDKSSSRSCSALIARVNLQKKEQLSTPRVLKNAALSSKIFLEILQNF